MPKNKINIFLDSGAFSALTQGTEVNIYEYIEFIKKHEHLLTVYANLDEIGATPNRETAEKTLQNQRIMEKAGLKPLPAFHQGEPYEYLEYYIANYDYIGLGGMVGTEGAYSRKRWLDICFGKYICYEHTGIPKVKIHGYGITALPLLIRYPWYSVDSTSWIVTGRMGSIFVPRYKGGEWIYDENSWKVSVSSRSPDRSVESGPHIDTFSPREKEVILRYLREKGYELGESRFKKVSQSHELKDNELWAEKRPKDKTAKRLLEIIEVEGVSNRYQLRDEMNIIYFQDLEKSRPEWPWAFEGGIIEGFSFG